MRGEQRVVENSRTAERSYPRLLTPSLYVEIEDWRVVAESFFAEFFHQLNGDQGDAILACVLFDAFFHHGAQEIGDPVEP